MGGARGARVPNNWQASFGGDAWEFDPQTGQYYLHSFLKEQPDVNWRNPEVRKAQLDVFNAYFKDERFRDNPAQFGLRGFDRQRHIYDMDQPEMVPLLQELRALLDSYPERYAVGETYLATPEKITRYAGNDRLHAAFSFDFTSHNLIYPWHSRFVMRQIAQRDATLDPAGIWPTTVMSNHDLPRAATRYSRGEDDTQARLAMTLLLTLRGTPFMYYGEEIGMRDVALSRDEIMDPPGKKYWPIYKGRDGCRSPMQWSAAPQAGFSSARPWLKAHPNYERRNVAAQQDDPNSLLNFTKKLISLRRQHPALTRGSYRNFFRSDSGIAAYERAFDNERIIVYLNFTGATKAVTLPSGVEAAGCQVLLTSVGRKEVYTSYGQFLLNPHEILIATHA